MCSSNFYIISNNFNYSKPHGLKWFNLTGSENQRQTLEKAMINEAAVNGLCLTVQLYEYNFRYSYILILKYSFIIIQQFYNVVKIET